MTSVNEFLSKKNVELIWDVLIDEDVIKNNSNNVLQEINNKINQIILKFYENEKQTTNNLMELNKKFITIIINYVNKNFSNQSNNTQIQPIQLQPIQKQKQNQNQNYGKEAITFEDLQTQRLSDFDKQLEKKQQEFTNAITLQLPEKPNFSDNIDEPITEIELEVKKIVAQRNYDIEQINNRLNKEDVSKWLKPTETSIKNEKLNTNTGKIQEQQKEKENKEIKYIKIDNNDITKLYENEVIDLNMNYDENPKKHISWADENNNGKINENNIFKKLKLLPSMLENNNSTSTYEEKEFSLNKPNISKNTNNDFKIIKLEKEVNNLNNKVDEINNRLIELFKILQKK